MKHSLILYLVLCGCLPCGRAEDAASLPTVIASTDSKIRYVGRFDTIRGALRCSWPNSAVKLRFQGTDIRVKVNEKRANMPQDYWQVVVDGKPTVKLDFQNGEHVYGLAAGLPEGSHTIELVKANESMHGITQILGFELNAGGSC